MRQPLSCCPSRSASAETGQGAGKLFRGFHHQEILRAGEEDSVSLVPSSGDEEGVCGLDVLQAHH